MSTGTTTTLDFSVSPQVLIEAVRAGLPGMRVLGKLGIVVINNSLPGDRYAGETVTVPYLASLGRMKTYAENAPIDVDKLTSSAETSVVARAGKAFALTDMSRVLRGNLDPMEQGRRMLLDAVGDYVERTSISAFVGLYDSSPALGRNIYSATTPHFFDLDAYLYGRSVFGDETRGLVGTVMHSQVQNRMMSLKDADGAPLLKVLSRDDENGVIVFEQIGPTFASDLMPVSWPVTSSGTTPPALTIEGSPRGMFDQVKVEITTLGARGTAQCRISTDGGTNWVASGLVIPASDGVIDRTDDLGLVFTFSAGSYATNNVYTARGRATTMLAKRGAGVFWHNNFGTLESQRDVLRTSEIVALELLGVTHAYRRLSLGTRAGVAFQQHNL